MSRDLLRLGNVISPFSALSNEYLATVIDSHVLTNVPIFKCVITSLRFYPVERKTLHCDDVSGKDLLYQ